MRSILTLIALACVPAFCQDAGQKLTNIAPPSLRASVRPPTPQLCSIPLLNATAPGTPVPMPNLMPRALPRPGLTRPNTPMPNANPRDPSATPPPLDRMSIVVPAPACPANFGHIAAPLPTPAPATKP
jgi:hypothetical protein